MGKIKSLIHNNKNIFILAGSVKENESYDLFMEYCIDIFQQNQRKIPQLNKYLHLIQWINKRKSEKDIQDKFKVNPSNQTMFCCISNGTLDNLKKFFRNNKTENSEKSFHSIKSFNIDKFVQKNIPFIVIFLPKIYIPGVIQTNEYRFLYYETKKLKEEIKSLKNELYQIKQKNAELSKDNIEQFNIINEQMNEIENYKEIISNKNDKIRLHKEKVKLLKKTYGDEKKLADKKISLYNKDRKILSNKLKLSRNDLNKYKLLLKKRERQTEDYNNGVEQKDAE